ncbi:MFS transporter [Glycomyces algeriensis]|uniref:MFS transporter n=1 Tax=Glycomyces algeriensis TaxID=256037 RepID=A0A9W6GCY6_9ACTN|nr:MFS transporter [Glycomyces algeriensis]MDA1368372.1 MFS transporter [Glycomyces algeriensis]MDR7351815.1 putative MFS family arabinose efflux permease [Glycomyces algeriensis]GLI44542.1 MFS transporter [Glycomyces algeriensis]
MDRRLIPLVAAAFAVGTDAFVITGLLPAISADLEVTTAAAGQLITVYALTYALAAPVLGALTAALDRRTVLLAALAVFVIGNAAFAVADDYAFAIAARIVTGLGAALITPQASAIAASIAPPERRGRYLAVVMGGLTAATALGVPLGSLLAAVDWQLTLWAVAGLGVLAAAGIAALLPSLTAPAAGLAARLAPLRDKAVLGIVTTTALVLASGYALYTYFGAAAEEATGGSQTLLTAILLAQGIGAVIGNHLAGRLTDRFGPARLMLIVQAVMVGLLGLAPFAFANLAAAIAISFAFGVVAWMAIVPQQHRLVSRHPEAAIVLIGLNSSALYAGIAFGGLVGGVSLNWLPVAALGPVGAVIGIAGLALTIAMVRAKTPAPQPAAA